MRGIGAQGARCEAGHYGAHGFGVSAHALVGCEGAGDLDKVHEEEHEGPGELQAAPDVCDEREGVFEDYYADVGVHQVAVDLGARWAGDFFEVWEELVGVVSLIEWHAVLTNERQSDEERDADDQADDIE